MKLGFNRKETLMKAQKLEMHRLQAQILEIARKLQVSTGKGERPEPLFQINLEFRASRRKLAKLDTKLKKKALIRAVGEMLQDDKVRTLSCHIYQVGGCTFECCYRDNGKEFHCEPVSCVG